MSSSLKRARIAPEAAYDYARENAFDRAYGWVYYGWSLYDLEAALAALDRLGPADRTSAGEHILMAQRHLPLDEYIALQGRVGGDRHPKIRKGVLLAAGCKIIGNIEVGRNARVGAGSVVLNDVPDNVTVAGVPAKVVGKVHDKIPAHDMDHNIL